MSRIKAAVLLALILPVLILHLSGCGKKPESPDGATPVPGSARSGSGKEKPAVSSSSAVIDDLLFAFEENGLEVKEPDLTPAELEKIRLFKERIEKNNRSAHRDPSLPKEAAVKSVGGVAVSIRRFHDSYRPRDIYEAVKKQQDEAEKRFKKDKTPYLKTTCLVKGPFIIKINHFKAEGKGGKIPLKIDSKTISLIEKSLMTGLPGNSQGAPIQ